MDVGKGIAFMAGQTRPLWDFEDIGDYWTRADSNVIKPIIAVPTTAGTGSETGRAGVYTNEETKEKKIIFHPKMLPSLVILDPELTLPLPKNLTAFTGMDALAHCLEAYSSNFFHPLSQGIALEGMSIVKNFLIRAYEDGNDIAKKHLEDVQTKHRGFQKKAITAITENPKMKAGMLSEIRSEFPLKAVSEGEETMAIGANSLDKAVMKNIFGTDNFDEIKEKLEAQPGPPPFFCLLYTSDAADE